MQAFRMRALALWASGYLVAVQGIQMTNEEQNRDSCTTGQSGRQHRERSFVYGTVAMLAITALDDEQVLEPMTSDKGASRHLSGRS